MMILTSKRGYFNKSSLKDSAVYRIIFVIMLLAYAALVIFPHPINRQCLSIRLLKAIFSPISVQAG